MQNSLFDTVKTMLPGNSALSNYRLPLDKSHVTNTQGLQFYEFDVPSTLYQLTFLGLFS
jgi:hypothetical protein